MSERRPRIVGILGGMGPAATVDFYGKLVAATPASRDQDHVPVVMWADPRVPDRTAALVGGGADPTPALRVGIDALAAAGAELLAVACNTAHAFVPPLARDAGLELVSIVDVTAAHLRTALGARGTVGLLATEGTVRSSLYDKACAALGIEVVVPGARDQESVTVAIAEVKAGAVTADSVAELHGVINGLRRAGASAVIAGCTEIVLALGSEPAGVSGPVHGSELAGASEPVHASGPVHGSELAGASEPVHASGPANGLQVIDPAALLAREVVRRSLG